MNIPNRRERALIAAADALLLPARLGRLFKRSGPAPGKIVCFRLERIGDLLMTLPAVAELRALAPGATIHLVVGSWNQDIAAAIPGIDRIETLDAAWLARPAGRGLSPLALAAATARWRRRGYDLAINFEPDIRSNLAAAACGARRTAGFASGGGGPLLDVALDYDPAAHTSDNAVALVRAAIGRASDAVPGSPLAVPDAHRQAAARLLAPFDGAMKIGMHVSGGRAIKQWPESRFRDVARHLVHHRGAALILTGTPEERGELEKVRAELPSNRVLDLSGLGLLTVAAVLERLDLFVTGDTGPMHLAHAVGTPVVAVFGPSDPKRYAPRGVHDTIVRIDLPCSPCNRIRRPPARCTGHTPDCLAGIDSAAVIAAIDDRLRERAPR